MNIPENAKILIGRREIAERVREVGKSLREFYAGADLSGVEIVWIAEGARVFAEEIFCAMGLNIKMSAVKVSSYKNSFSSSGSVKIFGGIENVKARRVLLIDDILDTGLTAKTVMEKLRAQGAEEIKTCFLLNKISKNGGEPRADFACFEISDKFVFGRGLDYMGNLRELKDIWALE